MSGNRKVAIAGAGLAGSEAALVLASAGIGVSLYEARPHYSSPAHKSDLPAELICSNSFKALYPPSAHGLLKAELSILESPLISAAKECAVPAGAALAVDRELFSKYVMGLIEQQPLITLIREELKSPPKDADLCIIAAGPLASDALTSWLKDEFASVNLHFYDAIAPIIEFDSIDLSQAFFASRRDDQSADYLNCPFTEDEYRVFYEALRDADRTEARAFEDAKFFEACLPVEVIAERGYQSLAYGPMRPVGLVDPRTSKRPYAVCQLRRETASGESFNIVGFQTRLTIPQQQKVFRLIPGLQNAVFLRYGSIHRNTYLDSPKLLSEDLSFKKIPSLFLAGQICGNEGYTESVATGHLSALSAIAKLFGKPFLLPPAQSALGSLLRHVTSSQTEPFTPSNIHFGLFPPLEEKRFKGREGKKRKKEIYCERALEASGEWVKRLNSKYNTVMRIS